MKRCAILGGTLPSLSVCLLGIAFLAAPLPAQAEQKIYFFNQEANINNFASLKMEFDTYLGSLGGYQLKPFNDRKIFEGSVSGNKDGILLLSSWHYEKLKKKLSLKPVLVGVFNGKSTQRKVLCVRKDFGNPKSGTMKIASAGSKEYTSNILDEILGAHGNELTVMPVPKDIDALMAVGYGMATAALTSENSLSNLEKINPKQYSQLKQLGKSSEMFLMIAATPADAELENKPLMTVLMKMGASAEGESKLRMLGLQGFRTLSNSEMDGLLK